MGGGRLRCWPAAGAEAATAGQSANATDGGGWACTTAPERKEPTAHKEPEQVTQTPPTAPGNDRRRGRTPRDGVPRGGPGGPTTAQAPKNTLPSSPAPTPGGRADLPTSGWNDTKRLFCTSFGGAGAADVRRLPQMIQNTRFVFIQSRRFSVASGGGGRRTTHDSGPRKVP